MKQTRNTFYVLASLKLLLGIYFIWNGFRIYGREYEWIFIQNLNLIFHEAGHVLFFIFGHFMHVLGGTLGEIGIPLIIAGYFYLRRDSLGTSFALWWLSTALMSVAVYARDARTQALPLITGDSADHDWTYLLGTLDLLRYDAMIGNMFMILSITTLAFALIFLWKSLEQDYRTYFD